jgi:hypothetical protein
VASSPFRTCHFAITNYWNFLEHLEHFGYTIYNSDLSEARLLIKLVIADETFYNFRNCRREKPIGKLQINICTYIYNFRHYMMHIGIYNLDKISRSSHFILSYYINVLIKIAEF